MVKKGREISLAKEEARGKNRLVQTVVFSPRRGTTREKICSRETIKGRGRNIKLQTSKEKPKKRIFPKAGKGAERTLLGDGRLINNRPCDFCPGKN